jgi:hypothetical protein
MSPPHDAPHHPTELEERKKTHRGGEEIDLETGESLGSPIEEGSGVYPPEDDEPDVT